MARAVTKIGTRGKEVISVIPAEADGWRAEYYVKVKPLTGGGYRINTIKTKYFKSKEDALKEARSWKRNFWK